MVEASPDLLQFGALGLLALFMGYVLRQMNKTSDFTEQLTKDALEGNRKSNEALAEVVGRPLLYGTTRRFLDVFGLADIEDLPPMEALRLKSATKPVEEVEPVNPPPIPEPQLAQCALSGA